MDEFASVPGMAAAWDRASAEYLARRGDDVGCVSYGALAPDEEVLHLLDDLRGLRVLDFGCGGGHNAIACAKAGAAVVGVDISEKQIAFATRLAKDEGITITWLHGGIEQVGAAGSSDLILAIHVFSYISDLVAALSACRGAMADGGRLVVAVDHPIRTCFWDEEAEDVGPVALRRYDDETPMRWRFDATKPMQSFPRMTQTWIDTATGCGLRLVRMVEPLAPPEVQDALWPEDSPLAPLRELPHTLILVFGAA